MYQVKMLYSKVHGITITQAELGYKGSLTLDREIMDAAGMLPYQEIQVVNNNNGKRLETYLIPGEKGTGVCCLNGAAARKGAVGDILIIMCFAWMDNMDAKGWKATRVFINERNKIENIETD